MKKTNHVETVREQAVKPLEEQFAAELEEGKSTARNGYRYSFAAYFVILFLMATVTDYLQINILDGLFLGIMGAVSIFFSVQFGMLFAMSYYFKESATGMVIEPIDCVTEFLPFSKEVYGAYVSRKLLPWRRGLFFGTLGVHLLGIHIFTRDNAFPHFIWEYPMDWGRYVLDIMVVLVISGLVSYMPFRCLRRMNKRRLYLTERTPKNERVKKIKSKKWLGVVYIVGIVFLSFVLLHMIHFIIYYEGQTAAKPMLLYAPYAQWVAMLMASMIACRAAVDMKELGRGHWKKWLITVLLLIVFGTLLDSNGTEFYEDSIVSQHFFRKTVYSFEDVREYELHVEKRLGLRRENILLLSMKNGKQVKMNLSQNEFNDALYAAYEPTGEWGFALHYVKQLKKAGAGGSVRDRKLIEEEIESIYIEDDGEKVKQCLEQICKLSEG